MLPWEAQDVSLEEKLYFRDWNKQNDFKQYWQRLQDYNLMDKQGYCMQTVEEGYRDPISE
jgi:uncharacterized protein YifE (UPF0438 family)